MLQYLAHSWLYRRLSRMIPNPILRTIAVAGVGMAATRLSRRRHARRTAIA